MVVLSSVGKEDLEISLIDESMPRRGLPWM